MAKRGGGDRVLESRHLVGLFLGVVLLCSVFFTLGYVMGRTQYGPPLPLHASAATRDLIVTPPVKPLGDAVPSSGGGEWDFYSDKNANKLDPPAPAPSASIAPAPSAVTPPLTTAKPSPSPKSSRASSYASPKPVAATPADLRRFQAPRLARGAFVLQLAAVSKETDAVGLADALQQKHFPAFVLAPAGDPLYRVQVGPYADQAAAQRAKDSLDHAGFKAIIKH